MKILGQVQGVLTPKQIEALSKLEGKTLLDFLRPGDKVVGQVVRSDQGGVELLINDKPVSSQVMISDKAILPQGEAVFEVVSKAEEQLVLKIIDQPKVEASLIDRAVDLLGLKGSEEEKAVIKQMIRHELPLTKEQYDQVRKEAVMAKTVLQSPAPSKTLEQMPLKEAYLVLSKEAPAAEAPQKNPVDRPVPVEHIAKEEVLAEGEKPLKQVTVQEPDQAKPPVAAKEETQQTLVTREEGKLVEMAAKLVLSLRDQPILTKDILTLGNLNLSRPLLAEEFKELEAFMKEVEGLKEEALPWNKKDSPPNMGLKEVIKELEDLLPKIASQALKEGKEEPLKELLMKFEDKALLVKKVEQDYQFLQIPIVMNHQQQEVTLALSREGSTSKSKPSKDQATMFISLSTNHLGRVSCYIKLTRQHGSFTFSLASQEVLDKVKLHSHTLEEALLTELEGVSFHYIIEENNQLLSALEGLEDASQYTFDMKV